MGVTGKHMYKYEAAFMASDSTDTFANTTSTSAHSNTEHSRQCL